MSRSGAEVRSSENQSKFIQERVTQVEKHFGDICSTFGTYTRKLGSVRDAGDQFSGAMMGYAEHESLNPTTKMALREFAENFSGVQDFRDAMVKRLDTRVLAQFQTYGQHCKLAKGRLKSAFSARDKELKQKKKLDNVKEKKPSDKQSISMAETELQKAGVDATYASRKLEEEIDGFEKKKLTDLKAIMMELVNTEIMFHAKALEMYTQAFHSLSSMDEEEDLEEFRNSLRPPTAQSRLAMQRGSNQGSRSSLNTTGQSGYSSGGGYGRGTPQGTPQQHRQPPPAHSEMNGDTMPSARSMYSDTQDEDDDDYEDEDEDESYEEETPRPAPQVKHTNMFMASGAKK